MKRTILFSLFAALTLTTGVSCEDDKKPENTGEMVLPEGNRTVEFEKDETTVLRKNPMNGWVLYIDRDLNLDFWDKYDNYEVPGVGKVKISDYATTAYLRTEWSLFEPRKGEYAWRNPDSKLYKALKACTDRGLRLSFRIIVDGTEQGQNTPLYVREDGAKGYTTEDGKHWSPYNEDPVFQAAYTKLIEELAKDFNDPDKVDFIDGYGLGRWGEGHMLRYDGYTPEKKKQVFEWITDLYARTFTKVPIVMNYHRLIGDTKSEGNPSPESNSLIESAVNKGYSLRSDAFGMHSAYGSWEELTAMLYAYKAPILMEGGYVVSTHSYWNDPSGKYRQGHVEDVRKGEFDHSREARVNAMDFRWGHETYTWFDTSFDLVQRFISEGGYRLWPDLVSVPVSALEGQRVKVVHRWSNMGWGYCPTNIKQWNQKYKAALALLDEDGDVVKVFVDTKSDCSKWLKGKPVHYTLDIDLAGIPAGTYTWAIGLVDTTKDNAIGLQMAVDTESLTEEGWAEVAEIEIG